MNNLLQVDQWMLGAALGMQFGVIVFLVVIYRRIRRRE